MIKLANKIALASLLGPKEGMEKKALNLTSLLRMSRNAATKGKLRRFSELLDKRNLAIDNVAHVRAGAEKKQRALADIERALIGPGNGPEFKSHRRLLDRSVAYNGYPNHIKDIISYRHGNLDDSAKLQIENDLHQGVAGPWTLKDLANYSVTQSRSNPIDKLTYPDL